MTDTGQVLGEGLPENAGMVEQPGIPAPGAYTYLDPSETVTEDEDLLLMPSAQGGWSDPQVVPAEAPAVYATPDGYAAPAGYPGPEGFAGHEGFAVPDGFAVSDVSERFAPEQFAGPEGYAAPESMPVQQQAPPIEQPAPMVEPVSQIQAEVPAQPAVLAQAEFVGQPEFPAQVQEQAQAQVQQGPVTVAGTSVNASASASASASADGSASGEFVMPVQEVPAVPAAEPEAVAVTPAAPREAEQALQQESQQESAQETAQEPQQGSIGRGRNLHRPGAHEAGGRDSGSVDLNGVRIPSPMATAPPVPAPTPPRRPLHMGPPVPDPTGGVVRSLADRGPAGTPTQSVRVRAQTQGPPTTGPEYLDVPREESAVLPGPQLGEIPPQPGAPWGAEPPTTAPVAPEAPEVRAETVVPEAPARPEPEPVMEPQPVPEPEPAEAVRQAEAVAVEPVREPVPAPEPEPTPVMEPPTAEEPVQAPEEPLAVAEPAPEPEPEPVQAPELAAAPEPEPVPEAVPEVVYAPEPDSAPVPAPEAEAVPVPVLAPEPEAEAEAAPEAQAVPEAAPVPQEGTAAPSGYDDAEREAVLRVMRERRDIRNGFRSDPIPHEVLLRVLEAAHTAPSVGHSQPWDFVVIRSAETRRSMHELAQRQRDAYAKSLPKGRAKQFKELKIEAILETPVNIVVTADPTRGGRHTLGRHTQPQMAPYSSALAVENLWLAARAEGLGVGWVSFFDEREMVRALGLPEHLEVVSYLCVGYVDEFPEEPELMQAGWSKRRPLSWVVHEETYGRRALPGEEPHDLLQETIASIRPLDAKALGEAWERQKRMTKPAGALGMLEIISAQLSGLSRLCPPPIPEPAAVAIFAGDHGVHAQGVTPWPQEVTGQMVANFLGGGAVCNAFANQVGAEVCVIDVGVAGELPATPGLLPRKVRAGTADFTTGPALSREDVLAAIEVGIETARDLVAAGNKALLTGEMGIANTTVSAALICVYTGQDPTEVTGRGTGINDEMHARKVDVVRRGLELHRPDPADPVGVLAAVGGLEHAALVGFLLGGASLRTPVILDGVSAGAAALVARAIAPEALAACIAGHRSAEPGHVAALNKLGLRPLVDLDLRLGEGTGALLALPVVQSAARAMHEVATFDSAGVTEK
ncbi:MULTISPECIES: nicotinate-nucleotide--dimethylbenzimidazole phosphoribosyltransferase [unclassified Streptomyces]|uniref:nicotinate-nucleotide--dimethylbenzimidazole phosphoribosyltransferase n=1 Tax=unclassified Streptomyces TaxID=2593676 RepID=UPI00081E1183|nr:MULTISPECIES: nicotinate-nucleotide--dimethylbenzimidazole phosphoribosyltransferase [unclassified Streptomyces]MYZ40947.1 nicotinate-nucleotide--dimethylbenzimidazole phosphoribosyltransferase [Streptomyces sp. SID4917]SCG09045.1 nicotinate-nucleotide-dimethylbenzimidazole phosphoribosyltransferase /cob(II)yrinic acid a,c-diamide reductase [Streptomyces sp. MnatMP-M17]